MFEGFKVVFVEDDASVRKSLSQTLTLAGFEVQACESAEAGLRHIVPGLRGVVVSDVRLPRMDGVSLLAEIRKIDADIPVALITAHGDVSLAVQAMRAGAYDFLEKPFAPERLVDVVTRALERRSLSLEVKGLRSQLDHARGVEAMLLGRSPAIETLRRNILNLAGTSADVMLVGETGTGKELVARCLHEHSVRRDKHFVAINCGGLPDTLLESELFGHEMGAFTTAAKRRIGKIEHANGGTLLLDEIESMPMNFQVKLLRVLQERKLERLGSNVEIRVDVRVVAATKVDLRELSDQQKFRADLYYRLNVAVLELPPLRTRREDVPLLFEHFMFEAAARHGREPPVPDAGQMRRLMAHDWPGNVRELRNAAERFVLGLGGHEVVATPTETALTLVQQMDQVEKALIEQSLRQHKGRATQVSDALGIGKKTLYDKLTRHGIVIDEFRPATGAAPE
ncbi:sigma-54-dependent transcriptional regulator [Piscinibacter terrae]|uniref:Sigma-54-dependent Fis family transcriptional regulator n=1 Tax=Piscinibacter terrae TaxID=2496871 RepID=A0A3N7HLA9_9BURK|nr:sigma-54 dependent transcriptional regulator [Albitalea terrae]RQP22887.1 sigma-54-dependent Fis family transcriptional regulator [Albitalea terrae]